MSDHATIVIVGGGYAGLFAARRAARTLTDPDARVVLIDPDDSWLERTRWHQLAAGEEVAGISRTNLFRGTPVDVKAATVREIDLERRRVKLSDASGEHTWLSFERLVLAVGSASDTAMVKGVRENAMTLDSATSSRQIGNALHGRPDARVLVVGAGLTGIQTAAQVADRFPSAMVTLAGPLARELPIPARSRIEAALVGLGVTCLHDTRVESVHPGGADTTSGPVEADVVVWTAGFAPSSLAARAGLAVDDVGQVVVDGSLRSTSHPTVFAAGDAASVLRAGSAYGAYAATATGATAGRNAALDISGRDTDELSLGYAFVSASLGHRDAVIQLLHPNGDPRKRFVNGRLAHAVKEGIERYVAFALRAERVVRGVYHWSPGPRVDDARKPPTSPVENPVGATSRIERRS